MSEDCFSNSAADVNFCLYVGFGFAAKRLLRLRVKMVMWLVLGSHENKKKLF